MSQPVEVITIDVPPTVVVEVVESNQTIEVVVPLPPDAPQSQATFALAGVAGPVGPSGPQGPQGVRGETGPQGPPGSTVPLTAIAGTNLSGQRVVRPQVDGTVVYATNTDLADASRALWLTQGAALAGDSVALLYQGAVIEPSWSWTDGPIFLGSNGFLTQIPPTLVAGAAFICQVGFSDGPTSLYFDPRTPIAFE